MKIKLIIVHLEFFLLACTPPNLEIVDENRLVPMGHPRPLRMLFWSWTGIELIIGLFIGKNCRMRRAQSCSVAVYKVLAQNGLIRFPRQQV